MKIFITGATGVIGRRVLPLLQQAGHELIAVARSAEQRAALEARGVRAADVSLFDASALRRAVAGHEAVINLATHMPPSMGRLLLPGAWSENDRIRREGAANLVQAAIAGGVQRFVQESFAPVYPDRGDDWIDEGVALAPSRYNRTILDAERSAQGFASRERTGVILRFGAFYGPDARLLTDMVRWARRGWVPLPGPARAFVSSISHDDAAMAVIAALALPSGCYNVTDDEPVSHREYVDALANALSAPSPKLPPEWATFLFGSVGQLLSRSLRISNRKLREASAWRPRYRTVREGWQAFAPAYKHPTGDWVRPQV
jgi:nucleoside-diphosphate-sugar epimerase